MAPPTLSSLFDTVLTQRPSLPFITYYDERTGERAELSAKSAANWIAKTHFFFSDDLGLSTGDQVYVALPSDWLTVTIMLGAWSAGLEVSTTTGTDAAVAIVGADDPSSNASGEVLRVHTAALSRSFADGSDNDFVTAVRPMPDVWNTVHSSTGAQDIAFNGLSHADVLARISSPRQGIRALLPVLDDELAAMVDALALALSATGSLVLVRTDGPQPELWQRRAATEHAEIIGP